MPVTRRAGDPFRALLDMGLATWGYAEWGQPTRYDRTPAGDALLATVDAEVERAKPPPRAHTLEAIDDLTGTVMHFDDYAYAGDVVEVFDDADEPRTCVGQRCVYAAGTGWRLAPVVDHRIAEAAASNEAEKSEVPS